ncbi:MAG: hypothetical protein RQ783_08120 [Gammaproteobacteria bacterium]|nr:hypothetical protein [Gammaproteobacteria bacterium]
MTEDKHPGLVAVANLKNNIQSQKIALFEFYATTDSAAFNQQETSKLFVSAMTMAFIDWDNARSTLGKFNRSVDDTSALLNKLSKDAEQATLAEANIIYVS